MQIPSKSDQEVFVEESYLLKEDGFTVNEFAVNEEIGKVAVLRRLDNKKFVFLSNLPFVFIFYISFSLFQHSRCSRTFESRILHVY